MWAFTIRPNVTTPSHFKWRCDITCNGTVTNIHTYDSDMLRLAVQAVILCEGYNNHDKAKGG